MRLVLAPSIALVTVIALLLLAPDPVPARSQPPPRVASAPLAQAETDSGAALFHLSCASCHGEQGQGAQFGPSLVGVGAASADFQLRTGRMPFTDDPGTQAQRKPPAFNDAQIRRLVDFVASLGEGPQVPQVETSDDLVPRGQQLFVGNCAPCHGATANGGAVGGGAIAPPLDLATPTEVVEAMIIGPGQMPVFDFDAQDKNAIASYVDYLQRSGHPGGFSIGGIGPGPEGFVGWVLGMGLLLVIVILIGREWRHKGSEADPTAGEQAEATDRA
jgi:ubiquinol-cytochrome c reductase cytochrome c subunit